MEGFRVENAWQNDTKFLGLFKIFTKNEVPKICLAHLPDTWILEVWFLGRKNYFKQVSLAMVPRDSQHLTQLSEQLK